MTPRIIATIALLSPLCFVAPMRAENPQHVIQLLKTKQCGGCDLNSANLKAANQRGVLLERADFRSAILRTGTILSFSSPGGKKEFGSSLSRAPVQPCTPALSKSTVCSRAEYNLTGSVLAGANLLFTNLVKANLSRADLSNAKLASVIELPPSNLVSLEGGTPDRQKRARLKGIYYNSPLFDPPDEGTRPSTAGGGTRGPLSSCVKNGKSIIPLMPKNNLALTLSQYPTLFWYVPESTAQTARFVVEEQDQDDLVYDKTFNISSKPGIVRLTLPTGAALRPLKVGKIYHWSLELVCDPIDYSNNGSAEGWIGRIEPSVSLVNQLKKTSPRDRPRVYANAGIWQETLTTLAELRHANPNDSALAADWEDLLKSVGLSAIAKEPLIPEQGTPNGQQSEGNRQQGS